MTVGVIDSGVDASNPDIAPAFNHRLSKTFAKDIPTDPNGEQFDGPCEDPSCVDPPDVDNNGHGTHVAGIIAAAANDFGISGVAPGVSLVNLHAGQDAGYFFLQPVVEALTYAADQGINVVNMSFYVDPWLMNCDRNPDDSPREQAQQRIVKMTMTRAMAYAHARGVVMVVAFGNEHTDNSHHAPDVASPDWPLGS
ncbi:S8 family serine peptidase, partial [Kibdelosporangium lantanae]